ncbi:MAG: hypothetical protein J1F25_07275 [Prevotellaceae bacterium]|nr:hypothetical protein [Prevotellaceae bacterium]
MKTLLVLLLLMVAICSLTSCAAISRMDEEEATRFGYNTGVWLRGGSESDYWNK